MNSVASCSTSTTTLPHNAPGNSWHSPRARQMMRSAVSITLHRDLPPGSRPRCWADLVCGNNFQKCRSYGRQDRCVSRLAVPIPCIRAGSCTVHPGCAFPTPCSRIRDPATRPVLFALDEVAQLRHFAPLSVAWTMGRRIPDSPSSHVSIHRPNYQTVGSARQT